VNESTYKPIFISGVPRSGTTWVATVLGSGKDIRLLTEPDNEKYSYLAKQWKKSLYRFPFGDSATESDQLFNFFEQILKGAYPNNQSYINHILNKISTGDKKGNELFVRMKDLTLEKEKILPGRPNLLTSILYTLTKDFWLRKNQLVIKSVHSGLCLPFITHHFQPKTVLIYRHPANIISSCLEPYQSQIDSLNDPLSFMGLQIGIFYYLWEKQIESNSDWYEITHEELCINPEKKYKSLFEAIGLPWTQSVETKIKNMNKPGTGFKPNRITSNLIDKWKTALTSDQIIKIQKGYSILPIKHYEEFRI
jgi:hypothetical protein